MLGAPTLGERARHLARIGFFGAMNRDVICATADPQGVLAGLGIAAPPLLETAIDDATAERGAAMFSLIGAKTFLGGSAYNAARIVGLLNAAKAPAKLEFFGLAGSVNGAAPHLDELANLGFATGAVVRSLKSPATCLALLEPAGRTLLTAAGANTEIGAVLRQHGAALAEGFARCDLIHLTSFLDPDVPELLTEILVRARQFNPALLVSIDPGVLWSQPEQPAIRSLLAQCNVLHANSEEMAIMIADGGLGRLLSQPLWTVVARTHDGVTLHHGAADGIRTEPFFIDDVDPVPKIVDAVGAGDTFTGAFLWAWMGAGRTMAEAARLGFAAARAKIGQLGPLTATALATAVINAGFVADRR